jgi:hypothetical protein
MIKAFINLIILISYNFWIQIHKFDNFGKLLCHNEL